MHTEYNFGVGGRSVAVQQAIIFKRLGQLHEHVNFADMKLKNI